MEYVRREIAVIDERMRAVRLRMLDVIAPVA